MSTYGGISTQPYPDTRTRHGFGPAPPAPDIFRGHSPTQSPDGVAFRVLKPAPLRFGLDPGAVGDQGKHRVVADDERDLE
jgi:hypothetical protein